MTKRRSTGVGPPFSAKYEGRCAGCGEEVLIGDDVRMVTKAVTHDDEDCLEEALS